MKFFIVILLGLGIPFGVDSRGLKTKDLLNHENKTSVSTDSPVVSFRKAGMVPIAMKIFDDMLLERYNLIKIKYTIKRTRVTELISEVMGADVVEILESKIGILYEFNKTYQSKKLKLFKHFRSASEETKNAFVEWGLRFLAEYWLLFTDDQSKKLDGNNMVNYIDYLEENLGDLDSEDITVDLVRDSLEDLMEASIVDYIAWEKYMSDAYDELGHKQVTLLKSIVRKEGGEFCTFVYSLIDHLGNSSAAIQQMRLWHQIYVKYELDPY